MNSRLIKASRGRLEAVGLFPSLTQAATLQFLAGEHLGQGPLRYSGNILGIFLGKKILGCKSFQWSIGNSGTLS